MSDWTDVDWSLVDFDDKKQEAGKPASLPSEQPVKRKPGRPRKVVLDADPR